jgi:hypothetical protein
MKEQRTFFWPLAFIATGVIWLMVTMGKIPTDNLWALTHLWPYLLIALGVGLILRSLWRPLGMIVSVLVVLGAMAAVIYAPKFEWNSAPSWGEWGTADTFSGAVSGSGTIKSETRKVDDFNAISIRYPGEIIVKQGEQASVTVEAEDNLLPQLTTKISGGALIIENGEDSYSKRVRPTKDVKITITVTDLNEINFSSAGTLQVDGLKTDDFELKLSGAGDTTVKDLDAKSLNVNLSGAGKITIAGKADDVTVSISGLGDFNGENLQSLTADAQISGAGTATLRVKDDLTAKISGAGTVNYYGSPKVHEVISGAGSVNKIEE